MKPCMWRESLNKMLQPLFLAHTMEFRVFIGMNLPCALLGLLVNIFYIFCLKFPPSGEVNIRQPVMTLLLFMVIYTSAFQLCLIFHISLLFTNVSRKIKLAVETLMFFLVRVGIPISVWLNIVYCTQIVPTRNAPLKWLKQNIKVIVYVLLIVTKTFLVADFILELLTAFNIFSSPDSPEVNGTIVNGSYTSISTQLQIPQILDIVSALLMVLTLLNLCFMLTATGATGRYLYQHIKKMTSSGVPFQSQLLQNQVRVTVTSLIQGLLHMLCSAGLFVDAYCSNQRIIYDFNIIWMLFDLYSLFTTINLGVGQSLFRQRVAQLCQKAGHLPSA